MAGLFDTLSLGSRSLQTYRKAIDTAGHNLANVNTPGYTRQRLVVESVAVSGDNGSVGMGAEATRIVRLQNEFSQKQLQAEASLEGSLQVKDEALRQTLGALQETIDRTAEGGTSTSGISQKLGDFFNSLQNLSSNPASMPERTVALQKAQELAAKFNQVDQRLGDLERDLNTRISADVTKANTLLTQIADLNKRIAGEEAAGAGFANDLRDSRQTKIEDLAKIMRFDAIELDNGTLNVVAGGQTLVDGISVTGTLETFDAGEAGLQVRVAGQPGALPLSGGSIEGAIAVRDGQLAQTRAELNNLAALIISEVNAVHQAGFGLNGGTGEALFTGDNASNIAVNKTLLNNPALFQASDVDGEAGNNATLLALIGLERKAHAAFGGLTFAGRHTQTVTRLAQDVATARVDLQDQQTVTRFVRAQRDSVSAVSLDEEMANLVMFQKAFQASAKLISMTDEMLATIIQM
jgi:flagellar hook-associated protein 1